MTIVYLGNGVYTGVDADTKPTTTIPTNSIFIETDTGEISKYNGSSWDIIVGNTKTETLTNKTIAAGSNTISGLANANIDASAAIATTKLADSANFLLTTNTKTVTNKTISGSSNTVQNIGSHLYEVYLDGSNWTARNTKTGAITSSNTTFNTVIQAALNALGGTTTKETVKVKGSASVTGAISIPSYCILDLTEAKLTLANSTATHMFVNSDTTNGNTQIEIVGGIIDGNKTNQAATPPDEDTRNIVQFTKVTNSSVRKMYIDEASSRAIRFRECTNCTAEYNTVTDTGAEGIQSKLGSDIKIVNNTVKNTGYSFITTAETPDAVVEGNYCDTNVTGTPSGVNISSIRNKVIGNTIKGSIGPALALSDQNNSIYNCSGTIVVGNDISGSTGNGGIIGVGYPMTDIHIIGNRVWGHNKSGIRVTGAHKNIVIDGNISHDNNDTGIQVSGTASLTAVPSQVVVSNNVTYNNGKGLDGSNDQNRSGIAVIGTDASGALETIVMNNICYDDQGTQTQKYGIRLANTDQCSVIGNKVRGNLTDGLSLSSNTNSRVFENTGYASNTPVATTTGTETLTNKTLTSPVISTISNTGTLTLPTSTDTLVGRATTDTLTNKTLTAPVISTISNTGTLTLPTSTDTLVGRATTDTLTNKTISSPTVDGTITLPSTAATHLEYVKAFTNSTAEMLVKWRLSEDTNSYISVENQTNTNAIFAPSLLFKNNSSAIVPAGALRGMIHSSFDSGTTAVFSVTAQLHTTGAVTIRPLFSINNSTTQKYLFGINELTFADAVNIAFNTTTGTKIGTATTQKIGLWNATPVVQPTTIAAVDTSTVDGTYGAEEQAVLGDLRTKFDDLVTKLKAVGILAT